MPRHCSVCNSTEHDKRTCHALREIGISVCKGMAVDAVLAHLGDIGAAAHSAHQMVETAQMAYKMYKHRNGNIQSKELIEYLLGRIE